MHPCPNHMKYMGPLPVYYLSDHGVGVGLDPKPCPPPDDDDEVGIPTIS